MTYQHNYSSPKKYTRPTSIGRVTWYSDMSGDYFPSFGSWMFYACIGLAGLNIWCYGFIFYMLYKHGF